MGWQALAAAVLLAASQEAPGALADAPPAVGVEGVLVLRDGSTLVGRLTARDDAGEEVELGPGQRIRLPPGSVVRLGDRPAERPRLETAPPRPGEGWFLLRDGRRLRGVVVGTTPHLLALDVRGDVRRVLPGALESVQWLGEPVPLPAPEPGTVEVRLQDGARIEGVLRAHDRGVFEIETADGQLLRHRTDEVHRVAWLGPRPPGAPVPVARDAGRTRYVRAPSAFLREPGELGIGIDDLRPNLQLGVLSPVTLAAGFLDSIAWGLPGGDVFGTLTAGASLHPLLHVAGGAELRKSRAGQTGTLLATVTLGTPERHLSLHAGPAPAGIGDEGRFEAVAVALAASARIVRNVAVAAEAWRSPSRSSDVMAAASVRFLWGSAAVDAGALHTPRSAVVPWLSLAFSWARPRDPFEE